MRQKAEHSIDPNEADPLTKTKFGDRLYKTFMWNLLCDQFSIEQSYIVCHISSTTAG